MKQFKSKNIDIPVIYFVETDEDCREIPLGIPYLIGSGSQQYNNLLSYLEVLSYYNVAKSTKMPFKWDVIFKQQGHDLSAATGNIPENIQSYIERENIILCWEKLRDLRILPTWLATLEDSVTQENINSVIFDETAFNKKLGLFCGAAQYHTALKNLLVYDLSSSMGDSLPTSLAILAKTMAHRLYADVIFTSARSYFYPYETLSTIDFEKEGKRVGKSNESSMFKSIVEIPRKYNVVVGFGDTDWFDDDSHCKFDCNEVVGYFRKDVYNQYSDLQPGYIKWAYQKAKKQTTITDWFDTLI